MTPSSLLSLVRSEIAKEREMLAKATTLPWVAASDRNIWAYTRTVATMPLRFNPDQPVVSHDATLIAARVNATKADLDAIETLIEVYESAELVSVHAFELVRKTLTNWLRDRGVEVKP